MTQKERIEMLELKVEALLGELDRIKESLHDTTARGGNTKVITSYGPKIVKDFIVKDELLRSRGG